MATTSSQPATLKRSLNLPLLTLYGLGVTIGAGIYVLVGATAAKAGMYAPISFLLAAGVVAFTGFSYAELGTRFPVSAGEAAYVRHGFNSKTLSLVVGLMVAASGIVSSAAISIGAAAYLKHFIPASEPAIMVGIIVMLGLMAMWGIIESVLAAAAFTLIEICGLGLVIYFGISSKPDILADIPTLFPPFEAAAWSGIFSAGLLAFFAFVGFEDIANVAEEVKNPGTVLPRAIILTLVIATLIYLIVVSVVVLVVPMETLSTSAAPLALIFERQGSASTTLFYAIASFATVNGILVQIIMASRVLYGLSRQKSLPQSLSYIHPRRHTPLVATVLITTIILILALYFPIQGLAAWTSIIVLCVFIMINMALVRLKWQGNATDDSVYVVPIGVPMIGLVSCAAMLISGLV